MATFVIVLLAIGSQTLKLKAETVKDKQIRNVQFPEAEDLWLNKAKLQSGRLIYGLTKGREIKGSSLFPDGSTNFVPNVNYEDGDGTIVRHIFDARRFSIDGVPNATARQDYETRTTVPFNLILSESEYNANFLSLSGGYVSFLNAVETANPEGITATGYRADPSEGVAETASELELSLKMQSNTNDSAVEHYYTIINNSKTKTTKVYPIKQVDTQFANDDYVEVYSRGENKGAYIVNRGINEGTNGKQYRLDYIMDFKNDNPENVHRPLFYAGTHYTDKNAYVFGPNMASQGDGVPVQRSM